MEYVSLEKIVLKPIIWIVDYQQWPRAYLRAELTERGFDAVGFMDLSQALIGLIDPNYRNPQAIVLELFDLFLTEKELGHLADTGIPVVVLGGAVELNEDLVREYKWAAVIQRPFTIGRVADVVVEVVADQLKKRENSRQ